MDARQQVKIWTLDDYVPSLYSLNITECDDKPRQTKIKPNLPTLVGVFENVHYYLLIVQWGHTRS